MDGLLKLDRERMLSDELVEELNRLTCDPQALAHTHRTLTEIPDAAPTRAPQPTAPFNESVVGDAAMQWLAAQGYRTAYGPEIGCGQPGAERSDWGQVVLEGRLRDARTRLNPKVPAGAIDEAFRKLTRPDSPSLLRATTPCLGYL